MRSSIRKRLFSIIALSLAFVIGLCMVILLFQFKDILLKQAVEDQKGVILKGVTELNGITRELDRITLYLCGDKMIPELLESSYESEVDSRNFSAKLQSSVAAYTNYPIVGSSLDYYTMLYVSGQFPSAEYLEAYQLDGYLNSTNRNGTIVSNSFAVENENWYRKTIEYNTKVYSFLMDGSDEFIFFSKLVRSTGFKKPFHNDEVGILVLAVKKTDIQKILNSAKATESTEILLTYEDTVLTGTGPNAGLSGQPIPERFKSLDRLKRDSALHQISYSHIKYSAMYSNLNWNLKMLTMVPERSISQHLDRIQYTMIAELLAVILIALLISTLVSRIFTRPIVYLTQRIQQISSEDHLVEISQKHHGDDEVSYLYQSYNHMIRRITQLIEEIKYNMDLQKKSELKALQSQINPHFIYNTLDVVNWMALCEGQKDISVMITSLVDIFRYSIRDPESMVTLEEELFHLSQYLKIQAMRYTDKFTFKMEIPEDCLSYRLPKLTIQPLVENSLLHVINKNGHVVHVHLSVEKAGTEIRIVVSDTGRLADPEILNRYLLGEDVLQYSGEGIGIRNLNQRIKMHFGNSCGLYYERREKELAAVLVLPQIHY